MERLLEVCEMHFAADRLTTGVGGTAVGCYREVQALDPANGEAVEGLRRVFGKYAGWARTALERGDAARARGHVSKLRELNPESPEVSELEAGIARLENEAAAAREKEEQAARERIERERREREAREKAERERKEQAEAERGDHKEREVQEKNFISIGTGGPRGVYFVVGNSVCRMVHKEAAEGRRSGRKHGIRCSAPSTGGSVYNIGQISQGNFDFGVAQSDWHYRSYNCSSNKVTCFKKLRAVFSVHSEPFHIVVSENSGIESWNDLKGKRVDIGNPGSGQRGMMELLMRAHGTDLDDFALATELTLLKTAKALCDGKIDAYGYMTRIPSTHMDDVTRRCSARIIDLNGAVEKRLVDDNPYYAFATIPKGMYETTDSDVVTFGLMATFVTSSDVPEEAVYEVTRAVFENLDDFRNLHPSFTNLDPEKMIKEALSAPLHLGAVRYYKEKGLM